MMMDFLYFYLMNYYIWDVFRRAGTSTSILVMFLFIYSNDDRDLKGDLVVIVGGRISG